MKHERDFVVAFLLGLLIGFMGGCGVARGSTTIVGGEQPYQRWVEEAKVPTPDVTLTVLDAACPGEPEAAACTAVSELTTWMDPTAATARVFFHELGHVIQGYGLTPAGRHRFRALTGNVRIWGQEDEAAPAERFADAYAECALGGVAHPRLCRLMRSF